MLLSFWYISEKIYNANNTIDFQNLLARPTIFYLFSVNLLMFFNWGLEAWKWRILVQPLEEISFFQSLKSIFSGITVSVFSPNRTGDFAGRVFFLKGADKIQASLKSFVGSLLQLLVTFITGIVAMYVYSGTDQSLIHPLEIIKQCNFRWMLLVLIILIVSMIFMIRARNRFSSRIQNYMNTVFEIRNIDLLIVFGLSLIRYFIFSFQYYLSLLVFNIDVNFGMALVLIAITFFVSSAIPTFALTEIAVRGATAVYFFSTVTADSTGVLAASLLLWIINLAIPAMIGGFFFGGLNFFKE